MTERESTPEIDEIAEVADQLEAEGENAEELRALDDEYVALKRPPGLLKRLSTKALNVASQQWRNFVGELQESREAMQLISVGMRKERDLTPEERDKIRAQMLDLVKMFPAGLIAAANSAFPVPGTGIFTPWILTKMNLMPSRWREAHLLDRLRAQQEKLRKAGHAKEADKLGRMVARIEHDAEEREKIASEARVLTHWDKNKNGKWDPDERVAYESEVEKLKRDLDATQARKAWYVEHEGEVFGAVRLSELDPDVHGAASLVCYDGKSGWVRFADLLDD